MKKISMLFVVCLLAFATFASAEMNCAQGWQAKDLPGDYVIQGGFSVNNGDLHLWQAGSGYTVYDVKSGQVKGSYSKPADVQSNGFGDPFGVYDPTNNKFYAATFKNGGESYVYEYNHNTNKWSNGTKIVNAYGGCVNNGNLYISGLNEPWNGGYGQATFISKYDQNPLDPQAPRHDLLIETAGNSCHLAMNQKGDIYYATYGSNPALYCWSSEAIALAFNDLNAGQDDTHLTFSDGQKLADLQAGANGIAVDEAGNVFVNYNDWSTGSSEVIMWNGQYGDGANYDLIASAGGSWFGCMFAEGDVLNGGNLYLSPNFNGGLVGLSVPEPATMALFGIGSFVLVRRKKRA